MKRGRKRRPAKWIHLALMQEDYEEAARLAAESPLTDDAIVELVTYLGGGHLHLLLPIADSILAFELKEGRVYRPYFKERLEEVKSLLRELNSSL